MSGTDKRTMLPADWFRLQSALKRGRPQSIARVITGAHAPLLQEKSRGPAVTNGASQAPHRIPQGAASSDASCEPTRAAATVQNAVPAHFRSFGAESRQHGEVPEGAGRALRSPCCPGLLTWSPPRRQNTTMRLCSLARSLSSCKGGTPARRLSSSRTMTKAPAAGDTAMR